MAETAILKIDISWFFSAEGGPIWITFRRLVQNDISTVVMWSKSKPDAEFQYGGRLGEFNGMSSQSHVSRCMVLPLGEFTATIPEPHATLQSVRIPSAILKIVFCIFICLFLMQFRLWRAAAFVSSPIHLLLLTPPTRWRLCDRLVVLLFYRPNHPTNAETDVHHTCPTQPPTLSGWGNE